MKKKITKILSSMLVFSLLAVFMATYMPYNIMVADAAKITEADIKKLEDKIAANDKKIAEANSKLDKLEGNIENYLEIVAQIELKISNLENNIADTKDLIEKYELLIKQTETQIYEREQSIATKYKDFLEIICHSYEDGTKGYLEILFDSEGLLDLLTRIDHLGSIITYEQKVLEDIEMEITDLNGMKATLVEAQEQTKELAAYQANAEKELQASLKEAQAQLKKLNNDKKAQEKIQKQAIELEKQLDKDLEELIKKYQEQQLEDANKKLLWPVDPFNKKISSPYGKRIIFGQRDMHTGIDIVGPSKGDISGDNIYAADDGTVLISKYNNSYGNYVVIDHGGKISTCYAHMSKRAVSAGEKVKRGQVIGYVGTTGSSTGYHLHFEVRVNGEKTDPLHKDGAKNESWLVILHNGAYVDPIKNNVLTGRLTPSGW
ncbi:MAG: peptidoglycan DD-metalloendopeptidase family protein [Clostridia bacterium]|nr:peptidoglycan DD-metalloendopeptidase family protein [Clostridia bacterium]